MGVIAGALPGRNWHRQVRRRGLGARESVEYGYAKTVGIARRFGFDPMGIDLEISELIGEPHALAELRARLERDRLVPTVGFGSLSISNDEEERSASLTAARSGLEAAATLGARTALFDFSPHGRVTRRGQRRLAALMLAEAGRVAGELGLRICSENYDHFGSAELVDICRQTGLPNVGILSDTGNWLVLGEDPVEATRRCLPYTFHAHVRDYALENDTYNGVALGDGLVPFDRVLPLLAEAGAEEDIVFAVEVDTDDRDEDACAERSYDYLRRWLDGRVAVSTAEGGGRP